MSASDHAISRSGCWPHRRWIRRERLGRAVLLAARPGKLKLGGRHSRGPAKRSAERRLALKPGCLSDLDDGPLSGCEKAFRALDAKPAFHLSWGLTKGFMEYAEQVEGRQSGGGGQLIKRYRRMRFRLYSVTHETDATKQLRLYRGPAGARAAHCTGSIECEICGNSCEPPKALSAEIFSFAFFS
jgi:hypothetical protein